MRADFFGPSGDTTWNLNRLKSSVRYFKHHSIDIRHREAVLDLVQMEGPTAIVHCASQPSHDLAKHRPFDDFDVNAVGTFNLLEAARRFAPEAPFIFMSTNKVYGDAPNELPLVEHELRYDFANPENYDGINEECRIDRALHSLFGASKAAADLAVQEYGRYFNLPTACLRGGCLTGPSHSGVELHGFLSFLVKTAVDGSVYTIFGYKGKQVRDQIHSYDVARAVEAILNAPRCAEVYNLGGGRKSNASILEVLAMLEQRLGRQVGWQYASANRVGDHICYVSDMSKFRTHYPSWDLTYTLEEILDELIESQQAMK
jgi:CDP-paratose 2-epimerase